MAAIIRKPRVTADRTKKAIRASVPDSDRQRLAAPAAAQPLTINWRYTISIPLVHLLAMLAFVPWFFSWTGVAMCLLGHFFVGSLGISVGYHRLLTHRGFTCPKWFERTLATLGVMCLQDTPARWVAIHRMHHQHPEEQEDPHSPFVHFLWSHIGWLLFVNREHDRLTQYERYARDILRDPYYFRLERWAYWLIVYIYSAIAYYLVGFLVGWATTADLLAGVQFGVSLMVWGVFVRTVFVWHSTWSVNSIGHLFGYRNYPTRDNSRNNWLVAMFSTGEGWHNNHHADPVSARHGHRWWEFDLAWITIRLWEKIGLVRDVKYPIRTCAPGSAISIEA